MNIHSRMTAKRRNRIEIVFRTSSDESSGVLFWTGKNPKGDSLQKGYLGVFVSNGYPELRVDLGAKNKRPVVIRSKVWIWECVGSSFYTAMYLYEMPKTLGES